MRSCSTIAASGAGGITEIIGCVIAPKLIVNSQFPARSVQELIAIANERPGGLRSGERDIEYRLRHTLRTA